MSSLWSKQTSILQRGPIRKTQEPHKCHPVPEVNHPGKESQGQSQVHSDPQICWLDQKWRKFPQNVRHVAQATMLRVSTTSFQYRHNSSRTSYQELDEMADYNLSAPEKKKQNKTKPLLCIPDLHLVNNKTSLHSALPKQEIRTQTHRAAKRFQCKIPCFKYTTVFDLAPSIEAAQHEPTLQGEQAQSYSVPLTVTQLPLQWNQIYTPERSYHPGHWSIIKLQPSGTSRVIWALFGSLLNIYWQKRGFQHLHYESFLLGVKTWPQTLADAG